MTFQLPPLPTLPRVRWEQSAVEQRARVSTVAPRLPWDKFKKTMRWEHGEHVALIGPTGQGKTTLLLNLLPLHPFVAVFATKPHDPSLDRLVRDGYVKFDRWRPVSAVDTPRRIIWPDASRIDSVPRQQEVFRDAFARVYRERSWTIAVDELWYIINVLKLDSEIRLILLQGRSLGISLLTATQRPRFVPLEVYDQSTHLFFWRDNDEENLRRLSGINVRSSRMIREIIPNLERHQVLYINTRTGDMLRTRAPAPVGG